MALTFRGSKIIKLIGEVMHIDSSISLPLKARPIVIVGAGSIVETAHLPAYKKAGWEIVGIFDRDHEKATAVANYFNIPLTATSLGELISSAPSDVVFDIAVPAFEIVGVLPSIPDHSCVLIQKPLGTDIHEASAIVALCNQKKLIAAMNFQKRFIPSILAAKRLIDEGVIGQVHHIEIRMNIWHPWHLWKFLFGIQRMEILYHSIHYIDLMRYFLGNPSKVYAKTVKHPKMMDLASVRSVIIMDYGESIQSFINTNHGHEFGQKYQDAFIKWEGTKGAIRHTLGKNINFPQGAPDTFEVSILRDDMPSEWKSYPIDGSWYPDAFIGSMSDLMRFAEGSQHVLTNSIESAFQTMQVVEAAYYDNEYGGTVIQY